MDGLEGYTDVQEANGGDDGFRAVEIQAEEADGTDTQTDEERVAGTQ